MTATSAALGQSALDPMQTGQPPALQPNPQRKNENSLRTAGKVVMIAGAVITVTGIAIIFTSSEGHSLLGGCADCGPAGVGLGLITTLGGLGVAGAGGIMWWLGGQPNPPPSPSAPRAVGLAWSFKF
jgi:hypothetical protein